MRVRIMRSIRFALVLRRLRRRRLLTHVLFAPLRATIVYAYNSDGVEIFLFFFCFIFFFFFLHGTW